MIDRKTGGGTVSRVNLRRFGWPLVVATVLGCGSSPVVPNDVSFTILYTNDEHGWMEPSGEREGAARLMGLWRDTEGYVDGGPFLVLSGGDNWTGPAISTWFQGESMVEVMNAMGYDAAALGNHDFDFTVAELLERIAESEFPRLAANIRETATGEVPDFAIPFIVRDVAGVQVGIVGLSSVWTPQTTIPANVADYDFTPYDDALREWVPRAWEAGADIVIVVGHICRGEMLDLAPLAAELGVSVIAGGHCRQLVAEVADGVALVLANWQLSDYARVSITYDLEHGEVIQALPATVPNEGGRPDSEVAAIVSRWRALAADELGVVVGYAAADVPLPSPQLFNLVTDSWLFAHPAGDIVITNSGGVRQSIPAGEITKGTIFGVLPFDNNLIEVELTGAEVIGCTRGGAIVAGMTTVGGFFHSDGTPLVADSVYRVLTTDYLYSQEAWCFASLDPDPYDTGIGYAQPTIDYLESLGSTASAPLDGWLDGVGRR